MIIDEGKEAKQLANDLQPMGPEEAIGVMKSFQGWVDQLRSNQFPLLAALSLLKAMSMVQFNFISDTHESMKKYEDAMGQLTPIRMDMLMKIAEGNSDVDREVAAILAKELIFLRSLNCV